MIPQRDQHSLPKKLNFSKKVKTYIGNKATYNAFLKVLNLFSQQIVDQNVLVSRVESFIGGSKELFDWFKSLVGYDGTGREYTCTFTKNKT